MKSGVSRRHGRRRWVPSIFGVVAVGLLLAPRLSAQAPEIPDPVSTLSGTVWDSTTATPLVGARVVLLGTDLEGATGGDGSFSLTDVAAGTYPVAFIHPRVSGTGFSLPAGAITIGVGESARLDLAIPSVPTLLAIACLTRLEDADGGAMVGVVSDAGTGIPLPGASLTIRWSDRESAVTTDGDGIWWVCGVPANADAEVEVRFPGRRSVHQVLQSAGPLRRQDFQLHSGEKGTVFGTVLDATTLEPVASAEVEISALGVTVVTGREGRFMLTELTPGAYEIQVQHLAYGADQDSLRVPDDGRALDLTIRLAPRVIQLDPLVVSVEGRWDRARRASGTRFTGMDFAQIQDVLPQINDTASLLRAARMPGVTVVSTMDGVCVELNRARGRAGCNLPALYVDGVKILGAAAYLAILPPESIERFEILSPLDAGAIYGTGSGNGVLIIETRSGPGRTSNPGESSR